VSVSVYLFQFEATAEDMTVQLIHNFLSQTNMPLLSLKPQFLVSNQYAVVVAQTTTI
jgi:hypothetical protein